MPGRYSISARRPSSFNQATASSHEIIRCLSELPIVSNVFVKSLARDDAALKDVIRNSRWPGGSIWGLSTGEAAAKDISLNYFLLSGALQGPWLSFRAAIPVEGVAVSFVGCPLISRYDPAQHIRQLFS